MWTCDNKNNGIHTSLGSNNQKKAKKMLSKNLFKSGSLFFCLKCSFCVSVLFLHQKYLYLAFIVAIVAQRTSERMNSMKMNGINQ